MGRSERRTNSGGRHPDFGEGGGIRRAFRRIFVEGDDFFSWSLPLFTVAGIHVRIHILYIVVIVARLLSSIRQDSFGLAYAALFMGTMFLFVLLHEFGHCLACRAVGGEADEILMWPLGGLAACRPPHQWKRALITTIGGPAVNVALALVFASVLLGLGAGWGVVVFNPFDYRTVVVREAWFNVDAAYWKYFLFSAYLANVYLVLFNVLLPMFPMDGGRIVQELLWWRMGYRRSMRVATNVGLFCAVVVGTYGAMNEMSTLFSIAVFAGITCFVERRRLAMMDDGLGDGPEFAPGGGDIGRGGGGGESGGGGSYEARRFRELAKTQERERRRQGEVDRILAKIADKGMGSLSRREQAALKEATERKRSDA